MIRSLLILLVCLTALTGCDTMKPEDFKGREPKLALEDYFLGKTKAWGLFHDRFGNLQRQFEVEIDGTYEGDLLTLIEDFRYDDGETEQRIWRIQKIDAHSYIGKADGVIGTAQGRAYGNAVNWVYRFALKVGESTWSVTFDDWLYLQSDEVMINKAEVSKFGFVIGEVTLVFRKVGNHLDTKVAPAQLSAGL